MSKLNINKNNKGSACSYIPLVILIGASIVVLIVLIISAIDNEKDKKEQYNRVSEVIESGVIKSQLDDTEKEKLKLYYLENKSVFESYGINSEEFLNNIESYEVEKRYIIPISDMERLIVIYNEDNDSFDLVYDNGID